MVVMALDHVRDLLHVTALTQSATDLNTTSPALFFSRWITYLCAPTFVFLSGASVWLSAKNNPGSKKLFLIKRGLWLIVLEFTIVNFMLWFDFQFRLLLLQVIAAIGVGFIVLSFLLKVHPRVIGSIGLGVLLTHNLVPLIPQTDGEILNTVRMFLFSPALLQVSPDFVFFIAYPLVPWISIMMLGYSLGRIFEQPMDRRNRILLLTGLILISSFAVLRYLNLYGDPVPWSSQASRTFTFLSFFNVTKYPPSLLFTCLFVGIMFLLLRISVQLPIPIQKVLKVFGKVPLFYYLLHLCFIRIALFIIVFLQGFHWNELLFGPFQFGRPANKSGIGLIGVVCVWMGIVALLYPFCKWYDEYKTTHSAWWHHYL